MTRFFFYLILPMIWRILYGFDFYDCHRLFPSFGGTWIGIPPYWIPHCNQNLTNVFVKESTQQCLQNRTIYTIGNSVARQMLFGLVEMLGGASVPRENQKELCPKNEIKWDDSCHQEYEGVRLKYLFLQWMDGWNYSDRGGFRFINRSAADSPYPLPNTVQEAIQQKAPHPPEDNCWKNNTRECLQHFFRDAKKEDVLIFSLGLPYAMYKSQKIDYIAWTRASAAAFRGFIAELFPGKVFRFTNAQVLKPKAQYTAPSVELDFDALWPVWQPGSEAEERQWYTIDQWAINDGRDYLYFDHVHFPGPLTHATLHQVFNLLCPSLGISWQLFAPLHQKIIVFNRTAVEQKELGKFSNISEEAGSEYYIFDSQTSLHKISETCLHYVGSRQYLYFNETEINRFDIQEDFPETLCREGVLATIDWGDRKVYKIQGFGKIYLRVLKSSDGGKVLYLPRWTVDSVPTIT